MLPYISLLAKPKGCYFIKHNSVRYICWKVLWMPMISPLLNWTVQHNVRSRRRGCKNLFKIVGSIAEVDSFRHCPLRLFIYFFQLSCLQKIMSGIFTYSRTSNRQLKGNTYIHGTLDYIGRWGHFATAARIHFVLPVILWNWSSRRGLDTKASIWTKNLNLEVLW